MSANPYETDETRACPDYEVRRKALVVKYAQARVSNIELSRDTVFHRFKRRYRLSRRPWRTDEQLRRHPEYLALLERVNLGRARMREAIRGVQAAQRDHRAALQARATCKAEVRARVAERRRTAASRPVEEIRKIPAYYRLPEENARIELEHRKEVAARLAKEKREREERERKARERAAEIAKYHALMEARKKQRKWMRPARSGAICAMLNIRRYALKEIRTEKKYARIGGVVNRAKLYKLQQVIRRMDSGIKWERRALRKLKAGQLRCKHKLVRALSQCMTQEALDEKVAKECDGSRLKEYLDLVGSIDLE